MKTTILGHPRIGEKRELKKAIESYWKENISEKELLEIASDIKKKNWLNQKEIGIDLIPNAHARDSATLLPTNSAPDSPGPDV